MGKSKISNWPEIFHEFEISNLSVEKFCGEKSIHPNTFYRNRKKMGSINNALVKIPVKTNGVRQSSSILIQIDEFLVKVPERVDRETLETTLRALKGL
jgi:hypothetical protein